MSEIIYLNKKQFRKKEVKDLIPFLSKMTEKYHRSLNLFIMQMAYDEELHNQNDKKIAQLWERWSEKISQIGGIPRQFWLIEFRSYQNFYYMWSYPDKEILYVRNFKPYYKLDDRIKLTDLNKKPTSVSLEK